MWVAVPMETYVHKVEFFDAGDSEPAKGRLMSLG